MTALIKTFSVQTVDLTESLGGNSIAGAFAVQTVDLTESLGGNSIAGAFAVAHGGYEVDGVTLPTEQDTSKMIRQK